jgi:hypothetical protein
MDSILRLSLRTGLYRDRVSVKSSTSGFIAGRHHSSQNGSITNDCSQGCASEADSDSTVQMQLLVRVECATRQEFVVQAGAVADSYGWRESVAQGIS